jgi:hypothetical protein
MVSIALNESFNGSGTLVSYLKQYPQGNHETAAMALASVSAKSRHLSSAAL